MKTTYEYRILKAGDYQTARDLEYEMNELGKQGFRLATTSSCSEWGGNRFIMMKTTELMAPKKGSAYDLSRRRDPNRNSK